MPTNKILRRASSFSKTQLIVFGLVFLVISGYLLFQSRAAVTCNLNATTSNFASQVSAATAGQTICLASGNYGTFTGTNKAITIAAADGATPQMTFSFGSGDSGFTLDGMTGMSGDILSGATNITIKNAKFTNSTQITGSNMNILIDRSSFDWNAVYGGGSNGKVRVDNSSGAFSGVTISNSTFRNGDLDGIHLGAGINVINNIFDNLCDLGTNHTDNIQFEGGTGGRIAGNYFHVNTCETQAITSFDGGTNGVTIENNVVDIARPWGIELYADKNSIVRHNTLIYRPDSNCDYTGIECGQISVTHKDTDPVSSGTQVYDNLTTAVNMYDTTGGRNDHNVSGKTAVYVGPTSTHDGFLLSASSPVGRNAASDGTNVGVYAIGGGGTPTPPPPPPPTGDTTPPTVSVSAPLSGSTVSGTLVTVSANAADNIGVSGVQFKLDGANLKTEDTSSPYSITWDSTSAANGTHTLSAVARDAAGNSTTATNVTVTVNNAVSSCPTSSSTWQNNSIASQTGTFNFDFDAKPSAINIDSVTGLSSGAVSGYPNLAAIVRFNSTGTIDARNGGAYAAATSVPYTAGTSYHFKLAVNVTAHTYTVTVTPAGGSAVTLGTNYAFRTEQASVSSLNNWAMYSLSGNHQVCNVVVSSGGSADTTKPTTSITAPTNGATVTGNVAISASASDNVGVTKVEFYVDNTLFASDTSSPYSTTWNASSVSNGTHTIYSRAYDAAGNNANSTTVSVTVNNADTTAPSAPTNLTASAASPTQVNLAWGASTDNVGVTRYFVQRNGTTIATLNAPATSYSDTTAVANTSYSYVVRAGDAASNTSNASNTATVTTPAPADTTAPNAPSGLSATAASSTQVNLSWSAATDPSGIKGYNIYRNNVKIASLVTTTSYGDATVSANTNYSYNVTAVDGANNESVKSTVATVTTPGSQSLSIWSSSNVPATPSDADSSAVEVGMKFRSDVAGRVTGVRFYKGSSNSGTHVGHLWSSGGTQLAAVTFSGETASGWQQANFATPVNINANTTYVVSYYAPSGHYAGDNNFFANSGVDKSPLHALRDGVDGGNGVYRYGSGGGFPSSTYQSSNYWVDVVFSASTVSQVAEAETGTYSNAANCPKPWNDSQATNGTAVGMCSNGDYAQYTFNVASAGSYDIGATMKSIDFNGSAQADIYVDGVVAVSAQTVGSSGFNLYKVTKSLTAGSHTIKVAFVNDAYSAPGSDRNLVVDQFKLSSL